MKGAGRAPQGPGLGISALISHEDQRNKGGVDCEHELKHLMFVTRHKADFRKQMLRQPD